MRTHNSTAARPVLFLLGPDRQKNAASARETPHVRKLTQTDIPAIAQVVEMKE